MRILISTTVLMFMLPKVVIQVFCAMYRQQKIDVYLGEFVGRDMRKIQHRTLMVNNSPLGDIDSWLHYFKGNLDLTGPRRMQRAEAQSLNGEELKRFNVAPGIISPFEIKQASGIAHKTERDIAVEFTDNASSARRSQLIAVWIIQALLGSNRSKLVTPPVFNLFGVNISNTSMAKAVATIMASLGDEAITKKISKFAFVNADCGNQLCKDFSYKEVLNEFDEIYPDGVGVKMAARMQGYAMKENVNGTDLFPLLCEQLQAQGKRLYLHGASKKVVSKVVENLQSDYPNLIIAGYSDGYSYTNNPTELLARINHCNPDLLLVAMGAPAQERWIEDHSDTLNVKAAMGVGGLFDFYSGDISRAPEWLRELSLEWVWRLIQQPKDKVKRYIVGNPLFLARAWQASLNKSSFDPITGGAS